MYFQAMYCKQLVYQGVTEVQFEELRAANYWKKAEEEKVREKQEKLDKMMLEIQEERENMHKEKEVS